METRTFALCARGLIAGVLALAVAGCVAAAPIAGAIIAVPQPASAPAAQEGNEPSIGALAPRKLAAGECGMFLWSKASDRNLVFFNTRGGVGKMVLGGREVSLSRATADGAEVLGQFESQTFRHDTFSIELALQFERRPGLARGAVIPHGSLRLKRADGWEYVLSVGGLVACEAA